MATRSDSYSSSAEVIAFTRHLLDGAIAFNSTTRPTGPEVERMIDRASGALNLALAMVGLPVPITNSTAKLACDDWVTQRACEYVEMTQRGVGYSDGEGSRTAYFANMTKRAQDFAKDNKIGFIRLGIAESHRASDGLKFTGIDAVSSRDDPSNSALAQPKFTRDKFDNPTAAHFTAEDDE